MSFFLGLHCAWFTQYHTDSDRGFKDRMRERSLGSFLQESTRRPAYIILSHILVVFLDLFTKIRGLNFLRESFRDSIKANNGQPVIMRPRDRKFQKRLAL